jgi:hypothetical protein
LLNFGRPHDIGRSEDPRGAPEIEQMPAHAAEQHCRLLTGPQVRRELCRGARENVADLLLDDRQVSAGSLKCARHGARLIEARDDLINQLLSLGEERRSARELDPEELGERIDVFFSATTLSSLLGAGHFSPLDAPAELVGALRDAWPPSRGKPSATGRAALWRALGRSHPGNKSSQKREKVI